LKPCRIEWGRLQHMGEPMRSEREDFDQDASSFVIRIWREKSANGMGQGEWRGWIEHVQTRERIFFRDIAMILSFIDKHLYSESST
jgi:hypothetical protein